MLVLSLIVSAVLLLAVNLAVRGKHQIAAPIGFCLTAVFAPMCIMITLPTVLLQAALLCAALLVLAIPHRGKRLYLPVSVAVTLIAYGVTTWYTLAQFQQLQQRFPVESLEARLPPRPPSSPPRLASSTRLDELETVIEMKQNQDWLSGVRRGALRRLHTDRVGYFTRSYGFGVGRMMIMNDEYVLKSGARNSPPITQPNRTPNASPPDKWEPVAGSGFGTLHEASVLDFVNPAGFGVFEDRRHVIGFQRHGFSEVPGPEERWAVETIDLVGLLLHDEPLAYVSKNLPRMDELRAAPTRPLDSFETQGLATLRKGEELFVRGSETRVRMLGAIRSTKQCLDCHGGARGDLLGAFSYSLRRGN
jgi:hypothetical protein